ncbi:putative malate dehydrogenase 1B [Apostichopus japonicus]|uniref:Putative malate dehydrogenase 1B n=1 Tax=Stichopus japonicus TaxID=307972 RepID=A0A2G8LJ52_STIJA|nr:putative malate dehydrogenase 1B [Apostichopus japonicus]
MLHEIVSGDVIGRDTELNIHLLVEAEEIGVAEGVSLEAMDMASPLLREISVTADPNEAMNRASLIIVMDDLGQNENEPWEDWIRRCGTAYTNYGTIIHNWASSDCKVVVAGSGPLNLGAYLIQREASNILRQNVIVPSRLPENRAKSAIARRINVNSSGIVDIIMWGNCGGSSHLDLSKGRVHGCEGAIWGPPSYSQTHQRYGPR